VNVHVGQILIDADTITDHIRVDALQQVVCVQQTVRLVSPNSCKI
jgi:hypothetical protein